MTEDPKTPSVRDEDDPIADGAEVAEDKGGAERAGLGKSEAEDKISK